MELDLEQRNIELSQQIARLQREKEELQSQLVHNHHFVSQNLEKVSTDRLLGSSVILTLVTLGGKLKIGPIAIRDGLSEETISALQKDLNRSYELSISLKPKKVK